MEAFWAAQQAAAADPTAAPKPPAVVRRVPGSCGGAPEFDACVAGGTLGVLLGLALQQRGHRVAIVERRVLQGRTQGEPRAEGGPQLAWCCRSCQLAPPWLASRWLPLAPLLRAWLDGRRAATAAAAPCPPRRVEHWAQRTAAAGGLWAAE